MCVTQWALDMWFNVFFYHFDADRWTLQFNVCIFGRLLCQNFVFVFCRNKFIVFYVNQTQILTKNVVYNKIPLLELNFPILYMYVTKYKLYSWLLCNVMSSNIFVIHLIGARHTSLKKYIQWILIKQMKMNIKTIIFDIFRNCNGEINSPMT